MAAVPRNRAGYALARAADESESTLVGSWRVRGHTWRSCSRPCCERFPLPWPRVSSCSFSDCRTPRCSCPRVLGSLVWATSCDLFDRRSLCLAAMPTCAFRGWIDEAAEAISTVELKATTRTSRRRQIRRLASGRAGMRVLVREPFATVKRPSANGCSIYADWLSPS